MFELRPYRRNQITNWNPFSELEALEKQFFDNDFFGSHGLAEFKTDITDEGDHYALKADLPGFQKEDIHLDLDDNYLTIRAERHSEHEQKENRGKFVRCERSYGAYSRSFNVSEIDTDKIRAKYDNGVLSLTLPKKTQQQPATRQLMIE